MKLGDFRVRWLSDGRFKLDGGAMFGVVPRTLWQMRYPVDDENYIPLALNCLLIETPEARILVDVGYGTRLTPKQTGIFRLVQPPSLLESLAGAGLQPGDIDMVVYTHLHHDHAAGTSYRDSDGILQATFPRARHLMQRAEWDEAQAPTTRSAHAYWADNWEPLVRDGLVDVVDGESSLVPGVRVLPTGGHTRGHQAILIESGGEAALHMGDLLPTRAHLNPLWVMAYDDHPMDSIAAKQHWLGEARSRGWWLTFYHDPEVLAATWDDQGNRTRAVLAEEALV